MKDLRLLLVAEATRRVGAGHAMRLANLGAAWLRAGGPVAATGDLELEFVRERYRTLGIEAQKGERVAEVVVVDSYDPAIRFEWSQVTGRRLKVLVDDVGGDLPRGYDVVWNPNAYSAAGLYPRFGGVVLSGLEFLAIRDDLPRWRPNPTGEVAIALGGGAASDVMIDALRMLGDLLPGERFAVTGDRAPAGWRRIAPDRFWTEAVTAKELVVAAGITVWEAAAVGIPVVVVMTAENQRMVYRWARDSGVPGVNTLLVDAEFLAHQLRALLAVPGPLPIVSCGTDRVVDQLVRLAAEAGRD